MTRRLKKTLFAAAAALAITSGTALAPAEAVVPLGTAAVVGQATQNTAPSVTPVTVDRLVFFTATGLFAIPPAAAAEVTMGCFIRLRGTETVVSGSGGNEGYAFCNAPDGTGIFVNTNSGDYTQVGNEIVFTSRHAGMVVEAGASSAVAVHLTLTLVPTSTTLRDYAVTGALVVTPRV